MNGQIQQLSIQARQAVQARDWTQVKSCAREILNRQRNSAEGRFLLGLAEKEAGRREQAVNAFERAIDLDNGRYDAGIELAGQYLELGRYGDAVSLLERFTPLLDNSPLYLDRAAQVYINAGLPDRAWPLLEKANTLQPGVDLLQAHLAECAVFVGEIERAATLYEDLLTKNPDHQRNNFEYSRLRRARDARHVDAMREILERTKLPPERNIYLYYALGKELEDLERWDEAFDHYEQGADAARSQADYEVNDDVALIDTIIEACDANWLADKRSSSHDTDDRTPIFIVGLPRSGTTLTERILSSHSQVESAGESFFIRDAVREISGVRTDERMNADIIAAAASRDVGKIADIYLDAIAYRLRGKPFFIEKYPENSLYLGFIAAAFPDARIVLQTRNPMDACFAMYKQVYFRYAYSLDDLAAYYVAYDRLVRHWRTVLGDRLLEVSYEHMVADQESETRRLLDELGLEFEEACLHFEKNVTASNTASTVQIREKAHTRSVRRWTRYEKQLQSLQRGLEKAGIDTE